MYEILQDIVLLVFSAVWLGGALALMNRIVERYFDYVGRFPPVNGVRLETFRDGNPFGPVARAISQVPREPQDDPELEQQRRAVRRAFHRLFLWVWGSRHSSSAWRRC